MAFSTTTVTATQPAPWKIRNRRRSDNSDIEYVGYATSGTATSTAGWFIQRNTYNSVSGYFEDTDHPAGQFADGTWKFNQVWDDRESLTYI